jgi:hypothetical protein
MARLQSGTTVYGSATINSQLFVSGVNASTSTTTGALQIVGGVGIGGNINAGGIGTIGSLNANYITISGAATSLEPSIIATGSDANIPILLQTKGTGAFDIAAGSSGTNISNGTTVTSISRTAAGSGYTSPPSWTASAPTTTGGVTATGTATSIGVVSATVSSGGSGYAVGNVLTILGGTNSTSATITVSNAPGGVISAVTPVLGGLYTVAPTNPVSVTGGAGTSATFNLVFGINNSFTITQPGSGYVEQPTITFSGGGGSGAAAIAQVGSAPIIRTLSNDMYFNDPFGTQFGITSNGSVASGNWLAGWFGNPTLRASGGTGIIQNAGSNGLAFQTAGALTQFSITHTASAVNYLSVTGGTTNNSPVLSAVGSDANISILLQPKGTGALDIAAGSSGTNISNGTTVTSISRTAAGSGYTSPPSWTASAPTTTGGVTATGTVTNIGVVSAVVASTGSGYAVGNVLTVLGGTYTTSATLTVASLSGSGVATITISNAGAYTVAPSNPVSVTGGAGTSATFTLSFGVNNVYSITQPGSGYVEQPSITFAGGGGSGAAAIAVVGSAVTIKSLAGNGTAFASLNLATPGGTAFQIQDRGGVSDSGMIFRPGLAGTAAPILTFGVGPTIQSGDAAGFTFRTNTGIGGGLAGNSQFTISHTSGATNALNVTGGATLNAPTLSAAGTDANIGINITPKGNGSVVIPSTSATINTTTGALVVTGGVGIGQNLNVGGLTNISYTGSADSSLQITGYNSKGGTGYHDFLRVTNGYTSATNINKYFRLNSTGSLEILRSDYGAIILSLTDTGGLTFGTATVSNNDATNNYLIFNGTAANTGSGLMLYDDGNSHIHARGNGGSLWLNANNGAIILGNQAPVNGGSPASAILMGNSTTIRAYANINGNKSYAISGYGYLSTGGAGTVPGGSGTVPYSLYCSDRIQAAEVDATSDERAKDIQGTIPLEKALLFLQEVDGILYTWNPDAVEHDDRGLKAGFGAQSVHKAGFEHMLGIIPNEKMKEQVDEDGWVHPEGYQLTMGYNQAIPYHHTVIKHLLDRIEKLEQLVEKLQGN